MSCTYTGRKSLYSQSCREGHRRYHHHTKPESTEARPWGQPLKKSEGASLNLGQWFCNRNPPVSASPLPAHRLVANAGLLRPATLVWHLGLRELVDHHLDLGGGPGRANTGDKVLTLVASALAGGDCIDDADALRAGGTAGVLGCVVKAPSTLGTFLRSFR